MTLTTDDYRLLNTIYIISKGRPQCKTAETLTRLNYPGQWFIVCGTNDETLPEYQKRWGEDRVLVFDWKDETTRTDTLDNFGFEVMPSGAVPVRNAPLQHTITHELSHAVWNAGMRSKSALGAKKEISALYGKWVKDKKKKGYGEYAKTNLSEFYAEGMTKAIHGNADKYTRKLVHITKKYGL